MGVAPYALGFAAANQEGTSGKPYIENYNWQPEQGTRFLVIRKSDGKVVHTGESEAVFAFHHVNAFEQDNEIVVDLVAYPNSSVIQSLYLEPLLHHSDQVIAAGELRRYHLELNRATATYEVLVEEPIELPRIHYQRCNTRQYQFVYGVGCSQSGHFIDQLVKVDVQNRNAQIWHQSDCYPGEPVFVAAPDAATEDEGVILSVGLDSQTQNSFLLILNAHSWDEMARVQLPYHLPFDFHGQYFDPIASSWSHLHR